LDYDEIEERVIGILKELGLEDIADLMPAEISVGMKKRVAIARAIAADPKAILYDEPTTGVDPITAKNLSNLIHKLNKEKGITSVVVTHDLKCAKMVADRVAFLHDGKIFFHDTFDEFLKTDIKEIVAFRNAMPHMMKYIGAE